MASPLRFLSRHHLRVSWGGGGHPKFLPSAFPPPPRMSFEPPSLALSCFISVQPLLLNPPGVSSPGAVLVSR